MSELIKCNLKKKVLNALRFSLETERHIRINGILMKKMKFRIPFRSDCHLILLACILSVAKCRGSCVVGRGLGSWVWVWVNVVGKKKGLPKNIKIKKLKSKKL